MVKTDEATPVAAKRDAFASIAFWQFMCFVLLLCVVWVNERFDLPYLILGAAPSSFSWARGYILSAAVVVAAIVTVGHTYERQRKLVNKLLTSCLYCHRVKTDHGEWMHVEDYFMMNYPVSLDRYACPDCKQMLETVEEKAGQPVAAPSEAPPETSKPPVS